MDRIVHEMRIEEKKPKYKLIRLWRGEEKTGIEYGQRDSERIVLEDELNDNDSNVINRDPQI